MSFHDGQSPRHTTSTFAVRHIQCTLHTYHPSGLPTLGIVVLYHGLNAHGTFPSIKYPAIYLASIGYKVFVLDLPGHGRCPTGRWSQPIYFKSAEFAVYDACCVAQMAAREAAFAGQRFYLGGSSMGGALALLVAERHYRPGYDRAKGNFLASNPSGIVLLTPMLSLGKLPWNLTRNFLNAAVSSGAGKWAAIPAPYPQGRDNPKLRRCLPDEARRNECDDDPHVYRGNYMKLGTAKCILDLVDLCAKAIYGSNWEKHRMDSNHSNVLQKVQKVGIICGSSYNDDDDKPLNSPADAISCPILCCISSRDETISNNGAIALCEASGKFGGALCRKFNNRTLISYSSVHNIFCDVEVVRRKVENDMMRWFESTQKIPANLKDTAEAPV